MIGGTGNPFFLYPHPVRRFLLYVFEGPRKPWQITMLIVLLYPLAWMAFSHALPHAWVWLVPWLLPVWWQYQRFLEVAYYDRISRRSFDWTCPACKYPLANLRSDFDPRTSPCPECGAVPQRVLGDAKEKLERASDWSKP